MQDRLIRIVIGLGILAVAGLIFIQSYWTLKTLDAKESEFHVSATNAFRHVAEAISEYNDIELPKKGFIKRLSSNYYAVNINTTINPYILEDYLFKELARNGLDIDFEYAVYDCLSQDFVYGNYCKFDSGTKEIKLSEKLPEFKDLTYYFVVQFPTRKSFVLFDMWASIVFGVITLFVAAFFLYLIWVILKQKRLSSMQRDFINNMTHEFKTPIASIKIASDMLSNQSEIIADERMSKYVTVIKEQNFRLDKQVERVLNIAKFEKENYQLRKEVLNIKELVNDVVKAENLRLRNLNGLITSSFSDNIPSIYADRVHLTNCIHSLLDNAIKYCKSVPEVIINIYTKGKHVILEIEDNGIGINDDQLPKLFNKFYRVPTGNLHDVKGFGLGLFYVKNICTAHNWDINIDSTIGKGTTVSLNIPSYE